jgi:hypothetical protein
LDTNRKYKKRNKKGKSVFGSIDSKCGGFQKGAGRDAALNMEKWLL